MANGDKTKAEERTKRIAIKQGEKTERKKAKLEARTERIKARHPQNERMEETVDKAINWNSLLENYGYIPFENKEDVPHRPSIEELTK